MNSFGQAFRISIYGESHGNEVGILIDGVKPGIKLDVKDFELDLSRRKPSTYGTPRKEDDNIMIKSGVFNGYTTGAPILIATQNNNTNSKDYSLLSYHFRPSHSDFVANYKYKNFNDYRGGGHFSGRLTFGLVCAGVVAKKIKKFNVTSEIVSLKGITNKDEFENILEEAKLKGDSVGGIVKLTCSNPDIGLGEPFFDSFESELAHLLFSVPAVKGVSFGAGFNGTNLFGSQYNDLINDKNGSTISNNDGGINGGITNGNDIEVYVAIKPTPSIKLTQETYNFKSDKIEELKIEGRHDTAIILRSLVVLESCLNICLTDFYLRNKIYE